MLAVQLYRFNGYRQALCHIPGVVAMRNHVDLLCFLQHCAKDNQSTEQYHLYLGVEMHQQIQALLHGFQVIMLSDMHSNAADRKWRYLVTSLILM